jgi:hypothetical protein
MVGLLICIGIFGEILFIIFQLIGLGQGIILRLGKYGTQKESGI